MSSAGLTRRKVAILGGGCGGLAAAWSLTATEEFRARFDVTVYERSWRLGGKGASGRAAGGDSGGRRIEEHGLHIWFGFYAHAFRMLKEAYAVAGMASGEDWWRTPFEKCDAVSLYDRDCDGKWIPQSVKLNQVEGPPPIQSHPFSARLALARAARMVASELRTTFTRPETRRGAGFEARRGAGFAQPAHPPATMAAALEDVARALEQAPSGDAVWTDRVESPRAARGPADPLDAALGRWRAAARQLEDEFSANTRVRRGGMPRPIRRISGRLRFLSGTASLVIAAVTGLRACGDRVPDDVDFRAWLKAQGACSDLVDDSPVLRGLYDLTFAYADGDKRAPDLAAGKALQSLLLMINYDGAFMWRMRAGMGDVVFSPLYLALRRRGVKFHFFTQVTGLGLAPDRPILDTIKLARIARVTAGPGAYEPLERIGDWCCWPARPFDDQLAGGQSVAPTASQTLHRGGDFDDVVLAIPVGALPSICTELADRSPRFKQMLDGAQTVRTKALQLWLTKPVHELRGLGPHEESPDPPATAYVEPFDTYCDMSQLLGAEVARSDGPKGVAYFCAVLPDDIPDEDAERHVRTTARAYLERDARAFWPHAFIGDEFDWNVLFDPEHRVGAHRLEAQYVRANVDLSDRYVRTPAGGVELRLDPGDSGFDNLVLAGDWTHNEIDGGCVEAAVISGQLAVQALTKCLPGTGAYTRLPAYVEYGELGTAPAPVSCQRLRMFAFVARADFRRLQALCDLVLNGPPAGAVRYKPRFAHVLLVFSVLDGVRSDAASHRDPGSATYQEAAIWVPVVRDGRLMLFMPYIWLDDPIAIATGRELYGFAKTCGEISGLKHPATDPWPPARLDELRLDGVGLIQDGDAVTTGTRTLLTVTPPGSVARGGVQRVELGDLGKLLDHFLAPESAAGSRSGVPGARLMDGLADLRAGRFRHVLLKQIRDAEHPDRAAVQQLVEAVSTIDESTPQRFRLLGPHTLEVATPAGDGLVDTLGIEPSQSMRGFTAEFGFRLERGEIVWPARS